VLGPLAAWQNGRPVPLGGAAQRAVLGLLVLYPGTLVHRTAIIDVLWPDDPPAEAANLAGPQRTCVGGVRQPVLSRLRT